ncbi:MAG TPA: hypothetical protein VJQ58_02435 [Burkholderiales bacterium]|nr:hypothetical protein [Burkholderiales bacterium]
MNSTPQTPWRNPDLRGTWEINHIQDASAFLRFVLASAPAGSQWIVEMASDRATFDRLAGIGRLIEETRWLGLLPQKRYLVIALTAEVQQELCALLANIDIGAALIEHHVYRDEELVMCSYDNLSCCWLSKAISRETLTDAARTQGFRFDDPDAGASSSRSSRTPP